MPPPEFRAACDGYRMRQGDLDARMAVQTAYTLNAWVDTSKSGVFTPERILGKPPANRYSEADEEESAQKRMKEEGLA